MTLFDYLTKHAGDRLPMHMPGHKRKARAKYLKKLAADIDITEIHGADDLHDPRGIIKEAQERASALWGAENSHILVGGSTAGILAGIYSMLLPGDKAIIARNCHKSVYHAMEICGAVPIYVLPESDDKTGIFLSVDASEIDAALSANPDVKLVVITSPTYEGVVSDVCGIANVCHAHRVPLLVDEAHGAHFGICDKFPDDAVACGADIVVRSLHKTLPSLTQTAMAHVTGLASDEKFARALNIFETSSPSYLLMAAADGCVDFCENHRELFEKWSDAIDGFASKIKLKNLSLFCGEDAYGFDKSKIVVSTACAGISGFELARILREEHKIEVEMAGVRHIVAMTGVFDGKSDLSKLSRALEKIDKTLSASASKARKISAVPQYVITAKEALAYPSCEVFSGEAEGCVCAEYVWAYPPGIPLIVPGEIVDESTLALINELISVGADVKAADKSLKTLIVVQK